MLRFALCLSAFVAVTGCATHSREAFLHDGAADHRYDKPLAVVLAEAKAILDERGYVVRTAPDSKGMATEWREEMGNSSIAATYSRYLVEGFPLGSNQSKVRVHRQTASAGTGTTPNQDAQAFDRSKTLTIEEAEGGGLGQREDPNVVMSNVTRIEAFSQNAAESIGGKRAENVLVTRDLQFEWTLMQRLSPEDAKELAQVAGSKFK